MSARKKNASFPNPHLKLIYARLTAIYYSSRVFDEQVRVFVHGN